LQLLEESPSLSLLPDIATVEKQLHSVLGVLQSHAATAAATEEYQGALACLLPHSLVIVAKMKMLCFFFLIFYPSFHSLRRTSSYRAEDYMCKDRSIALKVKMNPINE
jgi:hypothetical protein